MQDLDLISVDCKTCFPGQTLKKASRLTFPSGLEGQIRPVIAKSPILECWKKLFGFVWK